MIIDERNKTVLGEANKMEIQTTELNRNKYHNKTQLQEYFDLQDELVKATFGEDARGKRMFDVFNYLSNENDRKGGLATELLKTFKGDCEFVTNTIKATLSGCRGENMAFRSLETLKTKHLVVKNVELEFDGHKTEIDAVVLTKKGAVIVEVKNTSRNVVITRSGNLKRQAKDGTYSFDCQLGLKLNDKEFVLGRALAKSDYKNVPVKSIVVFTNGDIEVDNQSEYIKICSLSELPHVIQSFANCGWGNYGIEEMRNMASAINQSRAAFHYSDKEKLVQIKAHYEDLVALLNSKPEKQGFFERVKKWFKLEKKSAALAS